jgi:hypothetical protein
MASGYAGVENEPFYRGDKMMLFGDAKKCAKKSSRRSSGRRGHDCPAQVPEHYGQALRCTLRRYPAWALEGPPTFPVRHSVRRSASGGQGQDLGGNYLLTIEEQFYGLRSLNSPQVMVTGTGWLSGWAAHPLATPQTNAASHAANAIAFIGRPLKRG